MDGHFTDRDERAWQRRAEQRIAAPLDIGYWIHSWIRSLRRVAPPPGSEAAGVRPARVLRRHARTGVVAPGGTPAPPQTTG